jgi:hypothetical protein
MFIDRYQIVDRQSDQWVFEGTLSSCQTFMNEEGNDLLELLEYDPKRKQMIIDPVDEEEDMIEVLADDLLDTVINEVIEEIEEDNSYTDTDDGSDD